MAAPQWITNAGSLGIAVELKPFSLDLQVYTGEFRAEFAVISGNLPPGLALTPHGNVRGYPVGKLGGVPLDVNEELVFKFVIRCTNEQGELSDRTFSITVTGEDPPVPQIAPYTNDNLGTFPDGSWVEIDVSAFDSDPGDTLSYHLVGGNLPPGLTLSIQGLISGYADVLPQNFDSRTYSFDISVTDGKIPVVVNYNIIIERSQLVLSDYQQIYTISSFANRTLPNHAPVLLDRATSLDTVVDENYFFYKFQAKDFDGDSIGFEAVAIVRRPTAVGTVANPTLTVGESFSIDSQLITITGTSVDYVANDINQSETPGVSAQVNNNKLMIYTINSNITILNVDGSPLIDLGISSGTTDRNSDDTDPDFLTGNINQLLPNNLVLSPDTGWLHGYIDPISTGEQTYNFWVRVYKSDYELSNVKIPVDYATELPFSILNNVTQTHLDNLGLDVPGTDFEGKTVIFAQQEFFDATYPGLSSTSYTVAASVLSATITLDTVDLLEPGMTVASGSISGAKIISVNTGTKQISFGSPQSVTLGDLLTFSYTTDPNSIQSDGWFDETNTVIPGWTDSTNSTSASVLNQRAGLWRFNKSGGVYLLTFVEEIQQGSEILATNFVGTGTLAYRQPSVRLLYQSGTVWGPSALVADDVTASATVPLNTVDYIETGMLVTGTGITPTVSVLSINPGSKTVTLSTTVTLYGGNSLNFSATALTQTEPRYIIYQLYNPFSSLWPRQLVVTSSSNYLIDWVTSSDLGSLITGVPCKINLQATNTAGSVIEYHLVSTNHKTVNGIHTNTQYIKLDSAVNIVENMRVSGEGISGYPLVTNIDLGNNIIRLSSAVTLSDNTILYFHGTDLPRGLQLNSNGDIEGRASHQHFQLLDGTTFDNETTDFDRTYIVNIQARMLLNDPEKREITSTKSFRFTMLDYKRKPSSNLYLDFLLPDSDRQLIRNTIQNDLLVPDEYVYRSDDHWFGRQKSLRMLVAYGLDTARDADVINAIAAYHYKKKYIFQGLKWAQSLDAKGNVEYEVIYIDPLDQFVTGSGRTLTGNVDVRDYHIPITTDTDLYSADTTLLDGSQTNLIYLYPASLPNMQSRIRQILSPNNLNFLPSWMNSKQPDNRIPNFVQAIPLVYLKPGHGKLVLYKLQQALNISGINAQVDRYSWDDGLAINYDKVTQKFYDNDLTTFDQEYDSTQMLNLVGTVDFAVDVPFYSINNVSAQELISNGLVDGYRGDLNDKTLVFFRQESFTALDDFNDFDGWGNDRPQFDHQVKTTVTRSTVSDSTIYLESVRGIESGMVVSGDFILFQPIVTAVDSVNNTVTIDVTRTTSQGQELFFSSLYESSNYEAYRIIPGYNDVLQMSATTATIGVSALVYSDVINSANITLNNVNGVAVSQVISGAGVSGTPTITNVDTGNSIITVDSAQSLVAGTLLTFTGTGSVTGNITLDTLFGIGAGQTVTGTGVPGGTTVTTIDYTTRSITLSGSPTLSNGTTLTFVRTLASNWTTGDDHIIGDIVIYNDEYYTCVTSHTTTPGDSFPSDYFVKYNVPQTTYQRAGIWKMIQDSAGTITLEFVQALNFAGAPFDTLRVRSGLRHGGTTIALVDPNTVEGLYPAPVANPYTAPGFVDRDALLEIDTVQATIFDDRTTEFFGSKTDVYLEPDSGTKYIKFRRNTILDRGIVDV